MYLVLQGVQVSCIHVYPSCTFKTRKLFTKMFKSKVRPFFTKYSPFNGKSFYLTKSAIIEGGVVSLAGIRRHMQPSRQSVLLKRFPYQLEREGKGWDSPLFCASPLLSPLRGHSIDRLLSGQKREGEEDGEFIPSCVTAHARECGVSFWGRLVPRAELNRSIAVQ